MKNNVTVFNNEQFGQVRIIIRQGEPWFVGKDIAVALGYIKPENAIGTHVESEDKTTTLIQGTGSNYKSKTVIINKSGMYALILGSKLETAKAFKHWVTSEVLPSLEETGEYKMPAKKKADDDLKIKKAEIALINAEARKKNAEARQKKLDIESAKVLLQMSGGFQGDYRQVLEANATHLLTGQFLLPLPEVSERTYSAGEIAERLGVSANKIGRLSNENGMKTEYYGKWFYDKSRHSDKQVEIFRYYEKAIEVFRKLLEVAA